MAKVLKPIPAHHVAFLASMGVPASLLEKHPHLVPRMQEDEQEPEPVEGRIYIEGLITGNAEAMREYGYKAISAAMVRASLKDQSGNIEIFLNSPGGDVSEASAISTELSGYEHDKMTVITGVAASAATFIPLSSEKTEIFATAQYMIHRPWGCVCGTADKMRSAAENLDTIEDSVAGVYAEKSGRPVDEIKELMREETYMSAERAVEEGFADSVRAIIPSSAPKGPQNRMQMFKSSMARMAALGVQ